MQTSDLIQRSPLRALDSPLTGGLGRGELGIVLARHGAGKTPFLVAVALDHLLRGERVVHVSLDHKVDRVRDYYDQIFEEQARSSRLADVRGVHLTIERGRRIHTYLGGTFSLDKLETAVGFLRDHASFTPDLFVVDDYDFARSSVAELERLVGIARRAGAALWMTAVRHRHEAVTDPDGIPAPVDAVKGLARVIVALHTDGDIRAELLKPGPARALPTVLDPTTMLVKGR